MTDIANTLGVNHSYLSRRFKAEKGITITKYINTQRINLAKRLLLNKELNISEIAFNVGFGSIQHFQRIFRDVEDCSPSEYRKSKFVPKE